VPRRLVLWLWAAVLVLALGLRLPPLFAALPYMGYVDEGWVLHPVIHLISARSWDPGFYTYPTLSIYAIAGVAGLYSPVYAAVHGHPLHGDLPPDPTPYYDLIEPVDLIVVGRLATLAVSLGIVILTGLLARRLAGEAAGLFAALLAALVPALVIRSPIVTVDPWATFFALAAIYFAEGARRTGRPFRDALLAGAMVGCALTSKYPVALVALAVVPTLLRVEGDWRRKARLVGLAAAAGLLAAMVTMPALVLRPRQVMLELVKESGAYQKEIGDYWDEAVRQAEWDQPFAGPELGLPFVVCAVLGWIVAARDRRFASTAFAWALYAAGMGLLLWSYPFRAFRNLLPLVPLACVLVSLLLVEIRERLPQPAWAEGVAAVAALVLLLPGGVAFARDRSREVDTRAQAIGWVASHSGADDAVLVSAELGIPRGELDRLPGTAVELDLPHARARLRQRGDVELVITRKLGVEHDLQDLLAGGRAKVPYALVARFGDHRAQDGSRINRRAVLVFRRVDAAAGGDFEKDFAPPDQDGDFQPVWRPFSRPIPVFCRPDGHFGFRPVCWLPGWPSCLPGHFLASRAPIFLPEASSSKPGGPGNDPSRHLSFPRAHLSSRSRIFLREASSWSSRPSSALPVRVSVDTPPALCYPTPPLADRREVEDIGP
jgi:hypothetical protein